MWFAEKTGGDDKTGDGSLEAGGGGVMGGGSAGNGGIGGVAVSTGLGRDPAGLAMGETEESRFEKLVDRLDSEDLHRGTHL